MRRSLAVLGLGDGPRQITAQVNGGHQPKRPSATPASLAVHSSFWLNCSGSKSSHFSSSFQKKNHFEEHAISILATRGRNRAAFPGGAAAGWGRAVGKFLPVSQVEAWRQGKYSVDNSQRLQFGCHSLRCQLLPFLFLPFFFKHLMKGKWVGPGNRSLLLQVKIWAHICLLGAGPCFF